jgi:hypothetical protein
LQPATAAAHAPGPVWHSPGVLQAIGGPPTQAPAMHASPTVHTSPSLHAVPSAFGAPTHRPLFASQATLTSQGPGAGHAFAPPPTHAPAAHASSSVHASLSSQGAPSGLSA